MYMKWGTWRVESAILSTCKISKESLDWYFPILLQYVLFLLAWKLLQSYQRGIRGPAVNYRDNKNTLLYFL